MRSGQLVDIFDRQASYVPTAFTLTAQTGVTTSTAVEIDPMTSVAITVAGIDSAANISITDGDYSVSTDGGTNWSVWSTTTPTTISLNNQVKVRHTSSASYSTTVNSALTIGGVTDTFSTTTLAAPTPDPDPAPPPAPTAVTITGPGQYLLVFGRGQTPVQSGDGTTRFTAQRNGNGIVLIVRQGSVVLPAASFASSSTRRATSAEFHIHAGETATVDAAGRVTQLVLGTDGGSAAGDPLTLSLPANLSIDAHVPRLDARVERLGKTLQQAIATATGGRVEIGQSNGVLDLTIAGQRLVGAALPAMGKNSALVARRFSHGASLCWPAATVSSMRNILAVLHVR